LTPLGAEQLYLAGSGIRNRYIASTNISQDTVAISGLSKNDLDNAQLDVMTMEDPYLAASALAFMQGLYPPFDTISSDEEAAKGDGGTYEFPLNGYQYPRVATMSELDFNHIWIAGQTDCKQYSNSQAKAIDTPAYVKKIEDTQTYYASLSSSVFPSLDSSTLNYANALTIYEAALYQYRHNSTIFNSPTFTTDDLAILRNLASEQQWTFNTPNGTNTINAVSGRTLAAKIIQKLSDNIASSGALSKLTVYIGSHEPFLAFFALSNLATGPSGPQFNTLPDHGSTMTFELFSTPSADSTEQDNMPMPYEDSLFVRFLFRNGSASDADTRAYTLFGRGNADTVIPWADFQKAMAAFALTDILDWCRTCETKTFFCTAFEDISSDGDDDFSDSSDGLVSGGSGSGGVSPTIGGVIGATVAVAAFIFLAAGLLLAGFRLEKRKKNGSGNKVLPDLGDISVLKRSGSGNGGANGGFKGADRLGSDADLAFTAGKGGAGATVVRHERVGSWELGESPNGDSKHKSLDKEIESGGRNGRVVSGVDYSRRSRELERELDTENPFVDPVRAVDQV